MSLGSGSMTQAQLLLDGMGDWFSSWLCYGVYCLCAWFCYCYHNHHRPLPFAGGGLADVGRLELLS